MDKAVLMSIQPKWCELIASGKKTVEVRKTRPKIETPFKVYIYCTNNGGSLHIGCGMYGKGLKLYYHKRNIAKSDLSCINGKIIGEFVCDCIEPFTTDYRSDGLQTDRIVEASCVDYFELCDYEVNSYCLYAWHISDLVIYDKPKELSEFKHECKYADSVTSKYCDGCNYYYTESNESIGFYSECTCDYLLPIRRPPQSWCYVEEVNNDD